ncbi:MAG: hypothetical protein ACRYG8_12670 [Janthinobacterium lividum]
MIRHVAAATLLVSSSFIQPATAALSTTSFVCEVRPGYHTASMPVGIRVEPTRIVTSLATNPPSVGYWKLIDSNTLGLVAAGGGAFSLLGHPPAASGTMFIVNRVTGVIRWTETGADDQPSLDRVGICIDAP